MKNKLQNIKIFLSILLISCGDITKTSKENTKIDEEEVKQLTEQAVREKAAAKRLADEKEVETIKLKAAKLESTKLAAEQAIREEATLIIQKAWKRHIVVNKRKKQMRLNIENNIEIENLEWDDMIFFSKQLNEENDAAKKIQQKWIQYKQANKIKRQQ